MTQYSGGTMGRKQVVEVKDLFGYDDRRERMVARRIPNLDIVRDDRVYDLFDVSDDDEYDYITWLDSERRAELIAEMSEFYLDRCVCSDERYHMFVLDAIEWREAKRAKRRNGQDRYKREWRQGHLQRHIAASRGL